MLYYRSSRLINSQSYSRIRLLNYALPIQIRDRVCVLVGQGVSSVVTLRAAPVKIFQICIVLTFGLHFDKGSVKVGVTGYPRKAGQGN